jgi:DNA-binding response OmpR family regulator
MKILLAEDDDNIVAVAKLALERLGGHIVTRVADGVAAVEMGLQESYDVILLDSMMPKKDGIRACYELKQEHQISTPIIFLSAKSQESDIREGLANGAIGYIQKPFDPKTISKQVEAILDSLPAQKAAA